MTRKEEVKDSEKVDHLKVEDRYATHNDEDSEENILDSIPTPPDGGYGWIICLVAFLSNFVVDGICSSMGIVKNGFKEKYGINETIGNLIGSLLIGAYLLAGPFVAGLVDKYGARMIVVTGACVSFLAFFLSTYINVFEGFLFIFSIIGGIGFGFIYLPSIVMVGYWFESKRALATSLSVAGSGVGGIVLPILINKVNSYAGLNGTVIFLSMLIASLIVFGMLYRDLGSKNYDENEKLGFFATLVWKICGYRSQSKNSTTPEVDMEGKKVTPEALPLLNTNPNGSRTNLYEQNRKRADTTGSLASQKHLHKLTAKSLNQSLNKLHQTGLSRASSQLSVALSHVEANELKKPLSRQDIFLQGSIQNLKEFAEEGRDMKSYRQSHLSISGAIIAEELKHAVEGEKGLNKDLAVSKESIQSIMDDLGAVEDNSKCKCIPLAVRNMFHSMIDVELLKVPDMILIAASNLLGMLAFYIPYFFIKDFAVSNGISAADGTFLVSLMNILNTLGRVFIGWFADKNIISALNLTNISLIGSGGLLFAVPFICTTYYNSAILWGVYGFVSAPYICLTSIVLADLLGVEKLSNSFGLLTVARGIACIIGTPVAGFFYDLTKDYAICFYIGGGFFVLAGIVSCLILCIGRDEKKKSSNSGNCEKRQIIKE
uniref:MFS domain-containing protein n=1 Tax=Strongyloides papillosus TaxID=174720 RepID=A0A0N5BSL4_STREA